MASIRRGYSDDFTLKNNSVGIGTSSGQEALDVVDGAVKGQDLKVTGISSFTAHEGFLRADHQIAENTTLSFDQGPSASLSGEIIVGTGVTVTIASVGLGTTVVAVGSGTTVNTIDTTDTTRAGGSEIECLKVYNTFTPPSGGTNERPYAPKPGELYYNYDFKTIEFFDGNGWRQVDNTTSSGRSLFAGGRGDPGSGSNVDYTRVYSMQVNTLGSVIGFGDLTLGARYGGSGCSNSTRGIVGGGWATPTNNFDIEYFTLASGGNGIDWGQNNTGGWGSQGASSSTRGLNAGGGYPSATATIDSILFSTVGSKEDFGDINAVRYRGVRSCNSTVRGVFSGGYTPSLVNTMDAKDLHSTADTVEFGELNRVQIGLSAVSDSTRGVWMGGWHGNIPAGSGSNIAIDMITIATFGNAVEFGELSDKRHGVGTCQNMTRGVVVGGNTPGSSLRGEYITIQSAGNAIDFGDLHTQATTILSQPVAMPDSHGGLGGF